MTPPRPAALRLVSRARRARPPTPPFGLRAWSSEASAVAVLLDAENTALDAPAAVATQIPHATELPPGTLVFVLPTAARGNGVLRWFGLRTIPVTRVARCTALLARGYANIGAGLEDVTGGIDVAWGISSLC